MKKSIPFIGLISFLLIGILSTADVKNPLVFIGELVKGGVNGAPLITDLNGKVAQGILHGEVDIDTAINCTTTDAVVTGVTIAGASLAGAGTYEITMSGDVNSPTGGLVATLHFESNGATTAHGQIKLQPFAGGTLTSGSQRIPYAKTMQVSLNGTNALEVWCQTSTGTATVANSVLTWKRLL